MQTQRAITFFSVALCIAQIALRAFHRQTAGRLLGNGKKIFCGWPCLWDTNETAIKASRGAVSRSRTTKPEMLVHRPRYVYRRRSERDPSCLVGRVSLGARLLCVSRYVLARPVFGPFKRERELIALLCSNSSSPALVSIQISCRYLRRNFVLITHRNFLKAVQKSAEKSLEINWCHQWIWLTGICDQIEFPIRADKIALCAIFKQFHKIWKEVVSYSLSN